MARDVPERLRLPIDPDVTGPFARRDRSRLPRIRWTTVCVVAAGGFVGGLVRYAVTKAWPTPTGDFPWSVFTVNTAGAFVLALLVVVVLEVMRPTLYVRPLIGTGFCGALTTFSSVVVAADQLTAHGHAGLAAGYVFASLAAGAVAVWLAVVVGRTFVVIRERGRS